MSDFKGGPGRGDSIPFDPTESKEIHVMSYTIAHMSDPLGIWQWSLCPDD